MTHLQQLFVEHYLQCFNATEAAKRAGYSERSATEQGYENLRKPHIARAIQERFASVAMETDEALARISSQARGIAPTRVRKRKVGDEVEVIELYDSNKALDQVAKARKLYNDDEPVLGQLQIVIADLRDVTPADAPEEMLDDGDDD